MNKKYESEFWEHGDKHQFCVVSKYNPDPDSRTFWKNLKDKVLAEKKEEEEDFWDLLHNNICHSNHPILVSKVELTKIFEKFPDAHKHVDLYQKAKGSKSENTPFGTHYAISYKEFIEELKHE